MAWKALRLKSPKAGLFVSQIVQTNNTENMKYSHYRASVR